LKGTIIAVESSPGEKELERVVAAIACCDVEEEWGENVVEQRE